MAKTNPALYYSLFSRDSLGEFAQLDTLREAISNLHRINQSFTR